MWTTAAVLTRPLVIEQQQRELPSLGPSEVLVRVELAGLCGSDMAAYEGWHAYKQAPVVLGHELSGIVERIGSEVTRVMVGDRVCAASFVSCGRCDPCTRGDNNLCQMKRNISHASWDGTFAQRVVLNESMAFPVPATLAPELAVLVEPLTIALHAVRSLVCVKGKNLLIIGAGSIGLASVLCARALGVASVICVDRGVSKGEAAIQAGANRYINVEEQPLLLHDNSPHDMDICIVAATYPQVYVDACATTRRGGDVIALAYAKPDVQIPINDYLRSCIQLHFSYLSTPSDFEWIVNSLVEKRISPQMLVTHRFPLQEVGHAMLIKSSHADSAGKILIEMAACSCSP